MLYRLLIGSNNKTKEVEEQKALNIIQKYFKGYTSLKGVGYWNGIAEASIIVEIGTERDEEATIKKLAHELATKLKQDAIGLQYINTKTDFLN